MENRKLKKLLDDYDSEGSSEKRLSIVADVKSLLTISPDIYSSDVPYTFHDITLMTCIVKTLKGYPTDKLSIDVRRDLCRHLSAVCTLFLQPTPQLPGNFLIDVLVILRNMQLHNGVPDQVEELYGVINKCVSAGTYNDEIETQLWLCSNRIFENAILQCFISETKPTHQAINNSNKITNGRWKRLVRESRCSRELFHRATSIVVSVCRQARGSTSVINVARNFFGSVHKNLQVEESISLFPSRTHSLLMLIFLPWRELPFELILVHLDQLCHCALDGLENGLWSVGDISMLALACPDWYQVLLEVVAIGKDSESLGHVLLSRMWCFDCPDTRKHLNIALKQLDLSRL